MININNNYVKKPIIFGLMVKQNSKLESILESVLSTLLSEQKRVDSGISHCLLTEEGRQKALKGIFGRSKVSDTEISEHNIENTFRVLERRKSYLGAASLAEELGMDSRAQGFYRQALEKFQRSGDYSMQVHCLDKLEMKEDAEKLYVKAAKQLAQKGHFAGAAKFAELAGMPEARDYHENAASLLTKEGRYIWAFEHAEKAGNNRLMGEISRKVIAPAKRDYVEETKIWLELNKGEPIEREQACRQLLASYEQSGDFASAAGIAKKSGIGEFQKLAETYTLLSKLCIYSNL